MKKIIVIALAVLSITALTLCTFSESAVSVLPNKFAHCFEITTNIPTSSAPFSGLLLYSFANLIYPLCRIKLKKNKYMCPALLTENCDLILQISRKKYCKFVALFCLM